MRSVFAATAFLMTGACAPVAAPSSQPVDGLAVAQEVLAVERAYAERAQREGQWTAFRATMTPLAYLFVPEPVLAADWLSGRADPSQSVRWQPHRAIVSCDGTMVATTGAAQYAGGGHGYFTTIWVRQVSGGWRWVADYGDEVTEALVAPATPQVEVAECPGSEGPPESVHEFANEPGGGSTDGTLLWDWVDYGSRRGLAVTMWIGPRYAPTIEPGPPTR